MKYFRSFLVDNDLEDVIPRNGTYTWKNYRKGFNNISNRLDWFFYSTHWVDLGWIMK